MAAAGSDDMTMSVLKAEWNEVQRKLRQADLTAEILLKAHRTIEAKDRAIQLLTSQIDTAKKNIKSVKLLALTHERLLDHLVCFTCGELLRDPYICIMTWGDACGRARAQLRGETIDPAEPPFYLKCPTCRVHEDNPIQNFFVKSLVAALAREEIL
ncbi:hypothetical protein CPB83DRAFT_834216 [Crepidotus variabilis]|uniref:Uncharacterized protein n=1 Tax=Crepidotus variabilis TaxID=179855 RepID=A0A9P6EKF9_9AGAR|nr:hypothetical protein CPB83DRAFT_834216 [Crepidotus variabilis]